MYEWESLPTETAYPEFDRTNPEFVAWKEAREASDNIFREDLLGSYELVTEVDEIERRADLDAIIAFAEEIGDSEAIEAISVREEQRDRFANILQQRREERLAKYGDRLKIQDEDEQIKEFLRYKTAEEYSAQHGCTLHEAMIELYGGANPEERLLNAIFYDDPEDGHDDDELDGDSG